MMLRATPSEGQLSADSSQALSLAGEKTNNSLYLIFFIPVVFKRF